MSKMIALTVSEEELAFIDRAVGDGSRAEFIRAATKRQASTVLGEDAPTSPARAVNALSEAAANAGMTVPQFQKYAGLVAAGVSEEDARVKATRTRRKRS
jgi:Arc/MetJ-type ribon-helix-helix transcriptional regulator